jgi:hypothetical protein
LFLTAGLMALQIRVSQPKAATRDTRALHTAGSNI